MHSLAAHFRDLRGTFLGTVLGWCFFSMVSFFYYPILFSFFTKTFLEPGSQVWSTQISEAFFVKLQISCLAGFFLNIPAMGIFFFRFVSPGLYKNERQLVIRLGFISFICTSCSIAMFYYGAPFFTRYLICENRLLQSYGVLSVSYLQASLFLWIRAIGTTIVVGQIPLLIVGILFFKKNSTQFLLQKSRLMLMAVVVFLAFFTPDGYSLLFFSGLATILLYATLFVVYVLKKINGLQERLKNG